MTKKEILTELKNYCEALIKDTALTNKLSSDTVIEYCTKELESLARKSSSNKKKSEETAQRAEKFYNALAQMEEPVTFAELKTTFTEEEMKTWTPQRMTALVKHLGDRVIKEVRSGKNYYSVA